MAKILVVEDDVALAETICERLKTEHHVVEQAVDGQYASDLVKSFPYDLLVLDWDLPQITGVELMKQYRAAGGTAKILMLTGKTAIEEKELGFTTGADDYLTKPFHMKELVFRVRALLRRPEALLEDEIKCGSLLLNARTYRVTRNGEQITLTPREFSLLQFFMGNPNQFFSAPEILDRVWSSEAGVSNDTVKTVVHRLRGKIGAGNGCPEIINQFGVGYKLEVRE